jgi:hypothetical protein
VTIALLDLFNGVKAEWSSDVTERTVDRFERRLVEETSRLRVDMTQGFAAIRQEVGGSFSGSARCSRSPARWRC